MKFTNEEKVIVALLAEVHQALKIKNGIDSKLIIEAIWSDNTWAIEWDLQLPWGRKSETPEHVKHVVDVLDMWSLIEDSYDTLSQPDKQTFLNHTKYAEKPKFPGFDGNNEAEYISAARMLIEHMNRFTRYAGRDLNSHHPTIDRSERMLRVFTPILQTLHGRKQMTLTLQELISVFDA